MLVGLSTNVFAGSDTTGIALRAAVYFLCKDPRCMQKAVAELDAAHNAGQLSTLISYREAAALPYLNAVLKESIRAHASVGLLLERYVPPEGLPIDGYFLKGGTMVGISPLVVNYNEEIFPEPTIFKPERWLDASEQQLKIMDSAWELNFGGGARKCVGRHISCKCQEMHSGNLAYTSQGLRCPK